MKAEVISAAALAEPTLASAPVPTLGVAVPDAPAPAPAVDSAGVPFNPKLHARGFQRSGRWRYVSQAPKRKGLDARSGAGVKDDAGESFVAPDAPAPAPAAPAVAGANRVPDKFTAAAEAYLRGGYAFLDASFAGRGEWLPDSAEEHAFNLETLSSLLRARNSEDLPPWVAALFAGLVYSSKRIQRPHTNVRWRMLCAYWQARFSSWLSFRKLAKIPTATVPHSHASEGGPD